MFIYSCEHCDKKFDRKPNLIRHYSRKFKCYDTSLVKIIKIKDTDGSIIEIIETQNETQNIPQNETQNEPQLETQNIPQNIETHTETQNIPQNIPQNIETHTEPQLEPQLAPQLEPQLAPQLEPPLEPQIAPQLEPQIAPQLEPQLETQIAPQLEPPLEPQLETQNEPQLETQNITQLEPQITFTKIKLIGKPIRKPIIATQTILPSEENLKQIHISNEHIKNSYIKLKTKEYNSKYRTYKNRKSNKPNQTPILSNYFDTFKKKPHTKRVYFKLP